MVIKQAKLEQVLTDYDARDDASKKTKTADGRESPAKAVFPIFQTLQKKKNGPQKSDNATSDTL